MADINSLLLSSLLGNLRSGGDSPATELLTRRVLQLRDFKEDAGIGAALAMLQAGLEGAQRAQLQPFQLITALLGLPITQIGTGERRQEEGGGFSLGLGNIAGPALGFALNSFFPGAGSALSGVGSFAGP